MVRQETRESVARPGSRRARAASVAAGQERLVGRWLSLAAVALAVALFAGLCFYQYRLPGIYYDEAFDVVPSMQILRGDPVNLARGVGIHLFGRDLPVMIGDYWGVVSTYAVLPLFALLGVDVLAVRLWPIGAGMVAVLLTYFAGNRLYGRGAGILASLLLAVFPSYVFWSRVGIYVISHIVAITLGIGLSFLRWRRTGRRRWLFLAALLTGIGLSTKLLFLWFLIAVPAAYAILLLADWAVEDRRLAGAARRLWSRMRADLPLRGLIDPALALAGFTIGAFPVIYYNLISRGSYLVTRANLFQTERGVNNFAILENLRFEAGQLKAVLNGGYFWFYGGIYTNDLYPWVTAVSTIGLLLLVHRVPALGRYRRATVFLLGFAAVIFVLSGFTVSILAATHLLILLPIPQLLIAAFALFGSRRLADRLEPRRNVAPVVTLALAAVVLTPLIARDLWVDARYHQALARTGGFAGFSSAIYSLADYLEANGIAQPYALDWGFKWNVMILTEGRVEPLEIYGSTYEPGPDFEQALRTALASGDPVFISNTEEGSAFPRLDAFRRIAAEEGREVTLERTFYQLDGKPVYYLFRVR